MKGRNINSYEKIVTQIINDKIKLKPGIAYNPKKGINGYYCK